MDPHSLPLLQTRTPYDEAKYLHALKRRGSPLLNSMAEVAKILECAG